MSSRDFKQGGDVVWFHLDHGGHNVEDRLEGTRGGRGHQLGGHHSSHDNRWWKPAPDRIEGPGDNLDTGVRKRESAKGFAHGFFVVLTSTNTYALHFLLRWKEPGQTFQVRYHLMQKLQSMCIYLGHQLPPFRQGSHWIEPYIVGCCFEPLAVKSSVSGFNLLPCSWYLGNLESLGIIM